MESVFSLVNVVILPFWALMLLAPTWRWTERIIRSPWIVAPPALIYAALLLGSPLLAGSGPSPAQVAGALASPTAAGIGALLGNPFGATVAWAHFVAFDLFVGRWAFLEGRALKLSHWVVAPVLFLILMLGPLGLLTFLMVRAVAHRRLPAVLAQDPVA